MARRFVVLDRDGTLIVERHYLSDPADVALLPGVGRGLRRLRELGFSLVVVTNQSAVGRGYFDEEQLAAVHRRMHDLLRAEGVALDGLYFCPHTPADNCACRKPRPGLLERAARELGFEPGESVVIGDKVCDIELGQQVGAATILVRTGYGAREEISGVARPDHVVDDVGEAARVIERLFATQEGTISDAI